MEHDRTQPGTPSDAGAEARVEFRQALEQLETCLETPFVPGELERWFAELNEARDKVESLANTLFQRTHKSEFQQIFEQDPGLEHRIEQLRREDEEALEQFNRFSADAAHLAGAAVRLEPDEARLKEACYKLVQDGLAAVIALRKQEVALQTWLTESLARDRGVVD